MLKEQEVLRRKRTGALRLRACEALRLGFVGCGLDTSTARSSLRALVLAVESAGQSTMAKVTVCRAKARPRGLPSIWVVHAPDAAVG